MQARKTLIPEVVLRHKDKDARNLIFEKYFRRYRKSKLLSVAWFLVLGAYGAHRIYLGQYIAAAIVFGLFVVSMVLWAVLHSTELGDASLLGGLVFFLPFIVILAELVLLPFNYIWANKRIRKTLVEDIQLTPYVPLR